MAFWQLRQWQMRTLIGSPCALKRTAPHKHPPSLTMMSSISRAAAGDVEHRARRKRAIFGRKPGDHRRKLFHQHKATLRNLRQHEIDMLLGDLAEDRRFRGCRRDGV